METNVVKNGSDNKAAKNGKQVKTNSTKGLNTTDKVAVKEKPSNELVMIEEIENSLQAETLRIDGQKSKLENRREQIQNVRDLLVYYRETDKALNLLGKEEIKAEISITITSPDGVCSIRSNKIDTAKAIIKLLGSNSKDRLAELVNINV